MKALELTARQIARLVLAPLAPAHTGVDAKRRCHLIILLAVLGLTVQARGQEPIFISNFTGGEVLRVNQNTGSATVIYNPGGGFLPEGIRMGPDGKLYVCAPDNNKIIRLTLNTDAMATSETVYDQSLTTATQCNGGPCPSGPEGPSFNSNGDLYFNTRGGNPLPATHTGVWKIPAAQLSSISEGGATPVNVVTADQTGSNWGEGTAFDHNDNLLFVDRSGGNVWRFNTSNSTLVTPAIITGLATPIGIAVSPSGDIFVANTGGDIPNVQHFGPNGGSAIETYASDFDELSGETNDVPIYLAFDASGNLFVTTARALDATVGSVWEVTSSTAKTNLTNPSNEGGLAFALGIALGPTSAPAQNATLSGSGGSFNKGWPVGCNPNQTNSCSYTFGITYPAGLFPNGSIATVTPKETTQADWKQRTPVENPYNGTSIAPVAGEGGNGIIFSADCMISMTNSSPCPGPNTPTSYNIKTTWQSSQANYCGLGPGLLSADSDNTWVNTLVNCTQISPDPVYGTGGTKKCITGTKCLSEWPNVFGIPGPIASLSPSNVAFGDVPRFGFRIKSITVTNIGSSDLSISSVKVTGGSDDFFALSLCFEPLGPQESCTIFVAFFADLDQFGLLQSDTLTFTDNAKTDSGSSPHEVSVLLTAKVVAR